MRHTSHKRLTNVTKLRMFDATDFDRLIIDTNYSIARELIRSALFPHEIEQEYIDPRVLQQLDLVVNLGNR